MDPETARRLASGFWRHEHSMENDMDTWVCDKHKLNEAVQQIMMDQWASKQFYRDPVRFLDARFGEGTGDAYRHASQDRVAMRFNPLKRAWENGMATSSKYYSGYTNIYAGTDTTSTTSSTSGVVDGWVQQHMQEERLYHQQMRQKKDALAVKKGAPLLAARLVRNMPFVCGAGDLLNTLQRDFDHWTNQQKRILFA